VKGRLKKISIVLVCVLLPYVGSYLLLSEYGRYEATWFSPSQQGMEAKGYQWVPKGFFIRFSPNILVELPYLPLWALDYRLWHPLINSPAETNYPVHVLTQEEIGEMIRDDARQRESPKS